MKLISVKCICIHHATNKKKKKSRMRQKELNINLGIDVMKDTHAHSRTCTHPCAHPHTPYTHSACAFDMCTTPFSHRFKTVCTVHRQSKYPDIKKKMNSFAPNCLCFGMCPGEQRRRTRYDFACILHVHLNVQSKSTHTVELPVNHTAVDSTSTTAIL